MSVGLFFNRRGYLLDELEADFRCAWTINGVDPCGFRFPSRHIKHMENVLEFGNFLVVKKGQGLPDWVGRLEPRRDNQVYETQHSAVSIMNIFNQRMGKHLPLRSITASAGVIFEALISEANIEEETLIHVNDIYRGGSPCSTQISPMVPLMKNMERLFRQSRHEVEFVPLVENNRLVILANWKPRLGAILEHGLNARNCDPDETTFSEEGPIFNSILGIGAEREDGTRAYHWARDQASIDKYGARAMPFNVQSDDQNAVIAMTEAELLRLAWPRKIFKPPITNADDTFQYLRLGNVMPFDSPKLSWNGISTTVRLYGMAHDDTQNNAVEATLKEYL